MASELIFKTLPDWHKQMLLLLLSASFPGKEELHMQIDSAKFEIIDKNGSLKIVPRSFIKAPLEKTIPVEAWANDQDGILIQVMLFASFGFANMLEVLREDSEPVIKLPS